MLFARLLYTKNNFILLNYFKETKLFAIIKKRRNVKDVFVFVPIKSKGYLFLNIL